MRTQLLLFIGLLLTHWVADFVCQTHWQATNKSRNNVALGQHVATYTCILAVYVLLVLGADEHRIGWTIYPALWAFIGINGVLHFATEYFTSRWSSRLYAKQDWRNFFVVIGFDQLLHQLALAATMAWLVRTST